MIPSPNNIIIIVHFSDYSSGKGRAIPNDTRRCLMGEDTHRRSNLPDSLNSAIGREVVFPSIFSLVKKPITIRQPGGRKPKIDNVARGALAMYRYVGPSDELKAICDTLDEICKELKGKKYLGWADYQIMVAGKI